MGYVFKTKPKTIPLKTKFGKGVPYSEERSKRKNVAGYNDCQNNNCEDL